MNKRKAVNFPTCYLNKMWRLSDIECLNCDLWSKCETNIRLDKEKKENG